MVTTSLTRYALICRLCLIGAATVACQESRSASPHNVVTEVNVTDDGVVRVMNLLTNADTAEWIVREDLRIGAGVVGADPYVFTRVFGHVVDDAKNIYVLDYYSREIRVFDSTGTFARRFGRRGAGPGELETPRGLAWSPDRHVWIPDDANQRYSVFNRDGTLSGTFRAMFTHSRAIWIGGFDTDGRLYDEVATRLGTHFFRFFARRFNLPDETTDSVPLTDYRIDLFRLGRGTMPVPFSSRFYWTVDGQGGIWWIVTDEYKIHRISIEGDTTMIVEADLPSLKVTASERQAVVDQIDSVVSRGLRVHIDYSRIPSRHPAIENIDIDDEGQLWVRRVTRNPHTYFDVFDLGGQFVKSVETTWTIPEFWQVVIKDGLMYSVQRDSLGAHYVVRGRIERK